MDRQGFLAVSDLLNHRYCARITWFAYVLGMRQRGTVKTEHGRERHELWLQREEGRRREGAGVRTRSKVVSVEVASEALMLRGRMATFMRLNRRGARVKVQMRPAPTGRP